MRCAGQFRVAQWRTAVAGKSELGVLVTDDEPVHCVRETRGALLDAQPDRRFAVGEDLGDARGGQRRVDTDECRTRGGDRHHREHRMMRTRNADRDDVAGTDTHRDEFAGELIGSGHEHRPGDLRRAGDGERVRVRLLGARPEKVSQQRGLRECLDTGNQLGPVLVGDDVDGPDRACGRGDHRSQHQIELCGNAFRGSTLENVSGVGEFEIVTTRVSLIGHRDRQVELRGGHPRVDESG
ncbi:Uncharacterised protein [Mycobacteroides abscessus subsp. abscessus]|nr:Uncharacterised protein [Mycobacteroides abscessus subsp. abscessus]